jgi:hypothetical protein
MRELRFSEDDQAHHECLETELTHLPPRTIAEAQDRIEKLTGIRRGSTQVRAFLRNTLRLRWRKARSISVPPTKSVSEQVALQKDFVEKELNLIERLWKFVKKQALNNQHHINFQDFQPRIDSCLDQISSTHRAALTRLLNPQFQSYEQATVLAA